MTQERVRQALRDLRLTGMLAAFDQQQRASAYDEMGFTDRLDHLLAGERHEREDRIRERNFRMAKFKHMAADPADIRFDAERGLERAHVAELLTCRWIRNADNLLMSGPTGSGKTWLGCAMGVAAIQLGIGVRYVRTNNMLEEMTLAHGDGSIAKQRAALAKVPLLILDDFGIAPISEQAKEDLLELMEARIDNGATMVIGQLDPTEWHAYLDSPHLADAIMDGVIQRAHRIALRGGSLRARL
jgi:DNA replication protein DnaC